ncbi:T9SS type A sorting domain-containing protein, partial [Flavobacteriales bacterium]|nr:T9SS type A sorting domain-containing protein [Flavobacteriales bacterium]
DITGLPIGTYSVDITDTNSCTTSTVFTLTEPTPFQITIASTDYNGYHVSCNGHSDGGIDLGVSGSVPGYAYLWSNGATTEDINNLSAGVYWVQITDLSGCFYNDTISVSEPTLLQLTFYANGTSLTAAASGGTAPYNYEIYGPGSFFASSLGNTGTSFITNLLVNGTYTFVATDDNGCTDSTTYLFILPSSIYDFSESGFKLYPNPTSGDISIDFLSFQKEVKISITDVQGKKVYLEKIFRNCERETISLKNLSKGAYVVLVEILEKQYAEVIIYK